MGLGEFSYWFLVGTYLEILTIQVVKGIPSGHQKSYKVCHAWENVIGIKRSNKIQEYK